VPGSTRGRGITAVYRDGILGHQYLTKESSLFSMLFTVPSTGGFLTIAHKIYSGFNNP
jgi:hypothetical protein